MPEQGRRGTLDDSPSEKLQSKENVEKPLLVEWWPEYQYVFSKEV